MPKNTDATKALIGAVVNRSIAGTLHSLNFGADVNGGVAGPAGDTLYAICCAVGAPDLLKIVLDAGADPNLRDPRTGSALELAVATYESLQDTELLLDYGADVDGRDADGYTPLMVATGELEIAQLLVRHGANVNAVTVTGWSVLMAAVVHGTPSLIRFLLEKGADPELKDEDGMTALAHAVRTNREENAAMLGQLLKAGTSVQQSSSSDRGISIEEPVNLLL